jgi:DinB superfamily
MGAKSDSLATQFESKAQDAVALVEKLSDGEWKKVTAAERWSVGVTAHHLAGAYEAVAGIVRTLASGQSVPNFTTAMLDQMNAQHAKEHAACTRTETLALFRKGAAAAAPVVRGLSDEELAKSGTVFADAPPMTVEQLVLLGLINHTDEHMGSIRKTVGK